MQKNIVMRLQLRPVALATSAIFLIVICAMSLSSFGPHSGQSVLRPDKGGNREDPKSGPRMKASPVDRVFRADNVTGGSTTTARGVRVLVWVMTSPKTAHKARVVKSTWGSRVDPGLLLFMSSVKDPSLPSVTLSVKEGRDHLTAKTMQAFDYVYEHYRDKADFFMKADDDTYVIMENLRFYLSHLDPMRPFITGRQFKPKVKQGFPSGGAGYVISKAALERLARRSKDPALCKEDGPEEDVEFGRCMEKLGVPLINSTDSKGGSRFHPYPPMNHVVTGLVKNYDYWDANVVRVGPEAISEYPISFHYINPENMKLMHYFIYHVSAYGVKSDQPRGK